MKQLVSSSFDDTAKIWDLKGKLVTSLTGANGPPRSDEVGKYFRSAYFSPDGDKVITASGDTTAMIWPSAKSIHDWVLHADIYRLTAEDQKRLGMTEEE